MNCEAFQDLVQRRLDGEPSADAPGLREHLAACPDCRQLHRAALRLEEGLRRLAPLAPPAGLAERIAGQVQADRGRQRRLLLRFRPVAALAAGLLVVFLLAREQPAPAPSARPRPTPEPAASLRDSVAEAGSAVVGLTRRTADETVGGGRLLLPVVADTGPLPAGPPAPPDLEPPVPALRQAGENVSASLEPVTRSARRAFDLFLREVPAVGPSARQGQGS